MEREGDGRMEEEEEQEQRGCGWGWVAWLTGLDLAGWLAVTHNLRRGFSPGLIHTHSHKNTQLACTYTHHVSMWEQTTMDTHVFTNMSQHTRTVYMSVHTVWTTLNDSLWTCSAYTLHL